MNVEDQDVRNVHNELREHVRRRIAAITDDEDRKMCEHIEEVFDMTFSQLTKDGHVLDHVEDIPAAVNAVRHMLDWCPEFVLAVCMSGALSSAIEHSYRKADRRRNQQ